MQEQFNWMCISSVILKGRKKYTQYLPNISSFMYPDVFVEAISCPEVQDFIALCATGPKEIFCIDGKLICECSVHSWTWKLCHRCHRHGPHQWYDWLQRALACLGMVPAFHKHCMWKYIPDHYLQRCRFLWSLSWFVHPNPGVQFLLYHLSLQLLLYHMTHLKLYFHSLILIKVAGIFAYFPASEGLFCSVAVSHGLVPFQIQHLQ